MRETLPPNSMMVCCLYFDWFIEYFLAWIIQQSYWLVCWIIFVMGCCFGFDDCLMLWFCYCLGWLITHWILVMSWLFWFICVVWLIDFLLVYGYALVVMICLCDVMGVGCFEMLSVCLRLWRMGRWARAILTYIYIIHIIPYDLNYDPTIESLNHCTFFVQLVFLLFCCRCYSNCRLSALRSVRFG